MLVQGTALPAKAVIDGAACSSTRGPELTPAGTRYLTELELAARWCISVKTLQRWRAMRSKPVFTKFGRSVRYPMVGPDGVLDMEAHATSAAAPRYEHE
jgi:hypothetical protein